MPHLTLPGRRYTFADVSESDGKIRQCPGVLGDHLAVEAVAVKRPHLCQLLGRKEVLLFKVEVGFRYDVIRTKLVTEKPSQPHQADDQAAANPHAALGRHHHQVDIGASGDVIDGERPCYGYHSHEWQSRQPSGVEACSA